MGTSSNRARRILALQEQLHRIERWKLLDLQRRAADLEAQRQDLIAALNDDDALQGLFIDARARRLTSIARQAEDAERQQQVQAACVEEQATRVACADRLSSKASAEEQRARDRRALLEIIEALVGPPTQASRKIKEP